VFTAPGLARTRYAVYAMHFSTVERRVGVSITTRSTGRKAGLPVGQQTTELGALARDRRRLYCWGTSRETKVSMRGTDPSRLSQCWHGPWTVGRPVRLRASRADCRARFPLGRWRRRGKPHHRAYAERELFRKASPASGL